MEEVVNQIKEKWNKEIVRVPISIFSGTVTKEVENGTKLENTTIDGYYMNCLLLNQRLYVPIINSTDPKAKELNELALAAWQNILGNNYKVLGFEHREQEPDFPESPETWHQWFTWDALHCRTREIPDIKAYVPGYQYPWERETPKYSHAPSSFSEFFCSCFMVFLGSVALIY